MSSETRSNPLEYARAIYEVALESWQKELASVNETLANKLELLEQLSDSAVSFAERQKKLDEVLPEGISEQARNFLYTLLKEGSNLDLLGNIGKNLDRMVAKGADVEVAAVTSAVPLTNAEKRQFKRKLATMHGEKVEVDFKVDEAIIGGVIVQVGDKILDGSVNTKLNSAREKLIAG